MAGPLFDTHCHLQDRKFSGEADGAIARAEAAGVEAMLVCGYDEESIGQALTLAERHRSVFAAAGVHPHDADTLDEALLGKVEAAAAHPRCVAIGEIGLDFYRDLSPRDVQREALEAQLAIALRTGLPVSVHTRAAEEAALGPLREHARAFVDAHSGASPGVMHCFAGSLALAEAYVEAGYVISVPCTITYPNNTQGVEHCIKVVSDASKAIHGEEARDGFIKARISSRAVMPQFDTKRHFHISVKE